MKHLPTVKYVDFSDKVSKHLGLVYDFDRLSYLIKRTDSVLYDFHSMSFTIICSSFLTQSYILINAITTSKALLSTLSRVIPDSLPPRVQKNQWSLLLGAVFDPKLSHGRGPS